MRPKRYPYSRKIKASTTDVVKAWGNCYSDFLAKNQKEQERSKQELDKATQKLYQQMKGGDLWVKNVNLEGLKMNVSTAR